MLHLRAKSFDYGTPRVLALKDAGQTVEGQYGKQVRWSTVAGDFLYLDPEPASDVEREMADLGIRFGEEFRLTRAKTSHGGSRFVVERLNGRDAGGHNVPSRSAAGAWSDAPVSAPKNYTSNSVNGIVPAPETTPITPAHAKFLAAYMVAVDTLLETRAYAQRKGLALEIRCEDVRCLAATIMIDGQKGGR